MTIRIADLLVYPVKSCRGIRLDRARVGPRGFDHDREWMIVDAEKQTFLTQREFPRMALIETALDADALRLAIPNAGEFTIPFENHAGAESEVTVWGNRCSAADCGDAIAAALTDYLRPEPLKTCRLVRMKRNSVRSNPLGKGSVSFADAFPFLGVSEASLADLNARLGEPLPMDRFRPNLVFSGCAPYEEDEWKSFRAGDIQFAGEFKCIRCAITTINQSTAERGTEPLATLAQYRKLGMKVIFGNYFSHQNEGEIAVGGELEILDRTR